MIPAEADLKRTVDKYPELAEILFFSLEESANEPRPFLRLYSAFPSGSGGGILFPPELTCLIFRRLIWFFNGRELLSFPGDERRMYRKTLLSSISVLLDDSIPPGARRDPDELIAGISLFSAGKPFGALVMVFDPDKKEMAIDVVERDNFNLQKVGEVISHLFDDTRDNLWPGFMHYSPDWIKMISRDQERNTLPLNLERIHKDLGDSQEQFFRDVLPGFLNRLPEQFLQIEEAFAGEDYSAVRGINHKIKGASASLYAVGMYRACCDFQEKLDREEYKKAEDVFVSVKNERIIVQEFLKTLGSGKGPL